MNQFEVYKELNPYQNELPFFSKAKRAVDYRDQPTGSLYPLTEHVVTQAVFPLNQRKKYQRDKISE